VEVKLGPVFLVLIQAVMIPPKQARPLSDLLKTLRVNVC
jgi:hypothetical protein